MEIATEITLEFATVLLERTSTMVLGSFFCFTDLNNRTRICFKLNRSITFESETSKL